MSRAHLENANHETITQSHAAASSRTTQSSQTVPPQPEGPGGEKAPAEASESWASWKLLAPLVGGGAVSFAYLIGVTFHQTHLEQFGIDPGAFPQGHSDYMVFAVLAALTDLDIVVRAISKSKALFTVIGTLFATGAVSYALYLGATWLGKRRRGRPPLSPRTKLMATYLLAVPLGGTYLMFAVPIVFAMAMILPVEIGTSAAIAIAKDEKADYAKGCAVHSHGKLCFRVMDGKDVVATGFIIEQSKETVALWDKGIIKVLPLEKRGLESVDALTLLAQE